MKDKDKIILKKMIEYIADISNFTHQLTFDHFRRDKLYQRAITSTIASIGELANKLNPEFLLTAPHIPWKEIINTRHRIVHDYEGTNWRFVWEMVEIHIPELGVKLEELLNGAPEYEIITESSEEENENENN